jgi:hypothetical protein
VAAHHRADRGQIRGAARRGGDDGRDLAEVVGAKEAGGDDRERGGVDVAGVGEGVDRAARDEEGLARPDVMRRALDGERDGSLAAVDRLLVSIVAMGDREARARGTANSWIATAPSLSPGSIRGRIAIPPTRISSWVLVLMVSSKARGGKVP